MDVTNKSFVLSDYFLFPYIFLLWTDVCRIVWPWQWNSHNNNNNTKKKKQHDFQTPPAGDYYTCFQVTDKYLVRYLVYCPAIVDKKINLKRGLHVCHTIT